MNFKLCIVLILVAIISIFLTIATINTGAPAGIVGTIYGTLVVIYLNKILNELRK